HDAEVLPGVRTYDYAFFVASEQFAFERPHEAATLVRTVRDAQRWIESNPETAVAEFAALGGFGDSTLEKDVYYDLVQQKRLSYSGAGDFGVVGDDAVTGTQDLADNFHALGVYPEAVDVRGWFADSRFAPVADAVRAELSEQ
ncbi:MAG: ABC transporter substrate-binding protein, partial [Nocardia sp.]|nr:ABC transporter substrate-binding protein [Nocardia sp.]